MSKAAQRNLSPEYPSQPKVRDHFCSTDGHPGLDCSDDPGRTDQSQAAECDVNVIVDRFMKTGVLPGVDIKRVYGDFSEPLEYHDAMNVVAHAQLQFDSLNAKVRKRFGNDPTEFLSFVMDPTNAAEMIKLGLADAKTHIPPSQPLKSNPGASNKTPDPVSDSESGKNSK